MKSVCSKDSVAALEQTHVAWAEVGVACALYWYFSSTAWLVIEGLLVPILLLRSADSIELGKKWTANYWNADSHETLDNLSESEPRLIMLTFFTVLAICLTVPYHVVAEIDGDSVLWNLGITYFALSTALAVVFAISPKIRIVKPNWAFVAISLFLLSIVSLIGQHFGRGRVDEASAIVFLVMTIAYFSLLRIRTKSTENNLQYKMSIRFGLEDGREYDGSKDLSIGAWFLVWVFLIPYILGLILRILCIRIVATVISARKGVREIPRNWYEICVCTDLFYPSALIPGGGDISPFLSFDGLVNARRTTTVSRLGKHLFLLAAFIVKLVAASYRFAFKATFWLWWPLLLFSRRPFDNCSTEEKLNRVRLTTSWATTSWLYFSAIATVIGYVAFFLIGKDDVTAPDTLFRGFLIEVKRAFDTFFNSPSLLYGAYQTKIYRVWIACFALMAVFAVIYLMLFPSRQLHVLFDEDLRQRKINCLSKDSYLLFEQLAVRQEVTRLATKFFTLEIIWFCLVGIGIWAIYVLQIYQSPLP